MVIGGAVTNPGAASPDGAMIVWRCDNVEPVLAFVASDPYVRNGLVVAHDIKEFAAVAGSAYVLLLLVPRGHSTDNACTSM